MECTICLQCVDDEEDTTTLKCNHTFHTHCIHSWFKELKHSCPNCRIITKIPDELYDELTLRSDTITYLVRMLEQRNGRQQDIDRLRTELDELDEFLSEDFIIDYDAFCEEHEEDSI